MTGHRELSRTLVITATLLWLVGVFAQTTPAPAAPVAPATPVLALPTPVVPTGPITVDEAVAIALRNNPAVRLAAQNVQIAEAQVGSAAASSKPSVGLLIQSTTDLGGVQATVAQPVYPATRWRAPARIAEANVALSRSQESRTAQQVAVQVRQAYFQVLTAQQLLTVAADATRVAQEQLRLAQTTFEAGTAPRLDVVQATAGLESARVNQLRAQNSVDLARAGLAVQMGVPANTPIQVVPVTAIPPVPSDVEVLVRQALAQRSELIQLNYRREQARANIDLVRLQREPIVNVQATYGKLFLGSGPSPIPLDFTLSGVANWSLYNGNKTRNDLQAAEIQLAELDTNARQIELGITLDVRQAYLNLQNAVAQLAAAQQQLTAATEALQIAQVRYDAGEGIFLEVETARLRQTQARNDVAQAQFQAQVAAAQLEFALGAPAPAPGPAIAVPAPAAPATTTTPTGVTVPTAPTPAPATPATPAPTPVTPATPAPTVPTTTR